MLNLLLLKQNLKLLWIWVIPLLKALLNTKINVESFKYLGSTSSYCVHKKLNWLGALDHWGKDPASDIDQHQNLQRNEFPPAI